jgi:diadenosine tetraphosphate (Ap4A) HIT family hydrolase
MEDVMSTAPTTWMPRAQWDALVRGDACPLCAEVRSPELVNDYGHTIADLQLSRLRLASNQFVPGYCVLICTRHVVEPYHLTSEERLRFFDDLTQATAAIAEVFAAIKMNIQILGNAVPHLHAHIVPRYYGDPAPSRPLDPGLQTVTLTRDEYDERVQRIKAAL